MTEITLASKTVDETVPVQVDWHDYLARLWDPGRVMTAGRIIRPRRARATGFDYEVTTAGRTGGREPVWPKTLGATVTNGSVVFTARAGSTASMRALVSTAVWESDVGLTLSEPSSSDYVYTTYVSGGEAGSSYRITLRVTLSVGGEIKEQVMILPVTE